MRALIQQARHFPGNGKLVVNFQNIVIPGSTSRYMTRTFDELGVRGSQPVG